MEIGDLLFIGLVAVICAVTYPIMKLLLSVLLDLFRCR